MVGHTHTHTLNKYDEAEPLLRDTLTTQRRLHGDGHFDTLRTCRGLATLLTYSNRCCEAEELSRGALVQARRTLGPEHPGTLNIARELGRALSMQQGKAVEAAALLVDTLAIQQRVCGPGHPETRLTAEILQDLQRE